MQARPAFRSVIALGMVLIGSPLLLWALVDARPAQPEKEVPPQRNEKGRVVLVVHGGAGVLKKEEMKKLGHEPAEFERALAQALAAGYQALNARGANPSVDAVEAAVRVLEDCELFNAGRGACFTSDGRVELDASIMEGNMTEGRGEGKRDPRKRGGAVTCVSHIKNPISAARALMEMEGSRHVLLSGEGAETIVLNEANRKKYRLERVSNIYFWTDRRLKTIREEHKKAEGTPRSADQRHGTVGAVALNGKKIAAGTSTGGLTNKLPGRVGDTPLLGAGNYADDRACGVSCTGTGEVFMRHVVAHDVVARMIHGGKIVTDAAQNAIDELPDEDEGVGGLIALDREGRPAFAMSKRSVGLYRGYITEDGQIYVAIYQGDPWKPMKIDK